jgi:hypothetical protein
LGVKIRNAVTLRLNTTIKAVAIEEELARQRHCWAAVAGHGCYSAQPRIRVAIGVNNVEVIREALQSWLSDAA